MTQIWPPLANIHLCVLWVFEEMRESNQMHEDLTEEPTILNTASNCVHYDPYNTESKFQCMSQHTFLRT